MLYFDYSLIQWNQLKKYEVVHNIARLIFMMNCMMYLPAHASIVKEREGKSDSGQNPQTRR